MSRFVHLARAVLLLVLACAGTRASAQESARAASIERTPLGAAPSVVFAGQESQSRIASPASLTRTALALVSVLVLILTLAFLVRWLARKSGSSGLGTALFVAGSLASGQARAVPGLIEILARYPAGGGAMLVVMKFDKRVLLVLQSRAKGWRGPMQMTTLSELTQHEDVASVLLRTRADDETRRAKEFEAALRREDEAFTQPLAAPSQRTAPQALRPAPRTPAKLPVARAQSGPSEPRVVVKPRSGGGLGGGQYA